MAQSMDDRFRQAALEYHEFPKPGKLQISATKSLVNQSDLALAYSPGVAAACEEIEKDPSTAVRYTARGNLVAVITNGTAVLGLGNIGPLAAKPVMEGKAVLFKKFAGIDVFDIEVNEQDPDKLIEIIASLEPTFGGINLEDIKAPDCFKVERALRERMSIPVFHDDQHGTAIVVAAAILNGLEVIGKNIAEVKLVTSGAGAAAIACLDLLVELGVQRKNIFVTDVEGVVFEGRPGRIDPDKARYAQPTDARKLADIMPNADVFLGLSAGNVVSQDMIKSMGPKPLILALANPTPEILPERILEVRQDAIICTGRTDYPNQVNNVLCFPFIFRGALDVGASTITKEMEIAAVRAVAELARKEQSDVVAAAYRGHTLSFGPEYLIPKPFDPRLIIYIAPAVAQAAMDSGVATRPITDMAQYRDQLQQFVYHSGTFMKPIFAEAKRAVQNNPGACRVVYAEGEDERVLRALQIVVDEGVAKPIVIGRPAVLESRIQRFGLRLQAGRDFELINPEADERYKDYWTSYHELTKRKGVTQEYAKVEMRRRHSLIGSMMIHKGHADALICGTFGTHGLHLHYVDQVIGLRQGCKTYGAMNGLILNNRQIFLVDTHVNYDPTAAQIAEITMMAAEEMQRLGIQPKAALLSHSNFGSSNHPSALKMREALGLIQAQASWLQVDGEMHGDCALDESLRNNIFAGSTLTGEANLLVCPNIDAANIAYNLLKTAAGNGIAVGPVLLGAARPVHILTASATVRRIVNMTALAVLDACSVS